MKALRIKPCFYAIILLVAVMCVVLPVTAVTGTVTITYRGYGTYNVGDTIVFDGTNTVSNGTILKVTGPGLPTQGVPLFDLSGTPGTGNLAKVNSEGKWTFTWSTPGDTSKLTTAKYIIIASDATSPDKTASVTVLLKKPESYIRAKPSSPSTGDYVQISGMAGKDVSSVKIEINDSSGKVLKTFMTPVSDIGSFEYSFHADMGPGSYQVTASNPSLAKSLGMVLTITAAQAATETQKTSGGIQTQPATVSTTILPVQPVSTIPPVTPTPKSGVAVPTMILSIIVIGVVTLVAHGWNRK